MTKVGSDVRCLKKGKYWPGENMVSPGLNGLKMNRWTPNVTRIIAAA